MTQNRLTNGQNLAFLALFSSAKKAVLYMAFTTKAC